MHTKKKKVSVVPTQESMFLGLLAGRISAVNREFVYIDFDDERFPPCEGGEEVTEGASGRGKERRRKEGHNHLRFEAKNIVFPRVFKIRSQKH